ncbi:MAG: hypothetical protein PHG87_03995 [Candidatus Omnitrophica bacterium]|nr:hypothetical protein [Candidatus Omnitrophota bacterium]
MSNRQKAKIATRVILVMLFTAAFGMFLSYLYHHSIEAVETNSVVISNPTATTANASQRKLARATNGDLYAVYARLDGANQQIYYAKSTDNGATWIEQGKAHADVAAEQKEPAIAIDSSDNLYIAWAGKGWGTNTANFNIKYRKYNKATALWDTQESVTDAAYDQFAPALALDSSNNIHVAWYGKGWGTNTANNNIQYRKRTTSWQTQESVTDAAYDQFAPALALDSSNNIHVAWYGKGWGTNTANNNIQYRKKTASWQKQESVTDAAYDQLSPSLALDSADYVYAVWAGKGWGTNTTIDNIEYSKRATLSTDWAANRESVTDSASAQLSPSLALDSADYVYAVWAGKGWGTNTANNNIQYRKRTTAWQGQSGITDLASDQTNPTLFWHPQPTIFTSVKTNIITSGHSFIWTTGSGVKFYASDGIIFPKVYFVLSPANSTPTVGSSTDVTITAAKKDAANADVTVTDYNVATTVSVSADGAAKFTAPSSGNPISLRDIDWKSGAASVTITDDTAQSVTVKAADQNNASITGTTSVSFQPTAADKLLLNHPAAIDAGTRAAYIVTLADARNNNVNAGSGGQVIYLFTTSASANAKFYNAASGGKAITSVTIPSGSSLASAWYYDDTAGTYTITASDASPANGAIGLADAQDTIKVNPAADLSKKYKIKFDNDEAEIGDFRAKDFKPHVKMKRWGEECYFSIEFPESKIPAKDKSVGVEADKIKWKSPDSEAHFYKKGSKQISAKDNKGKSRGFLKNESGALEFEVVLDKKPASNIISLPIETKGLKFYYQGPLTAEEIKQGIVRPDEVVGSYAVYHESKNDGAYNTGKAFHIYRPKVIDATGNTIWGQLDIDAVKGALTITIDQSWLNSAAYPVTIDPEFGYMSIGSSSIPLNNITRGSKFTALVMTPATIGAYLGNTDATASHTAKFAIYKASDSSLAGQTQEVTIPASSTGWYTGVYIVGPSLTAVDYALVAKASTADIMMYFDSGTANQGVSQASVYSDAWPPTASFTSDNYKYSIYDPADITPPTLSNLILYGNVSGSSAYVNGTAQDNQMAKAKVTLSDDTSITLDIQFSEDGSTWGIYNGVANGAGSNSTTGGSTWTAGTYVTVPGITTTPTATNINVNASGAYAATGNGVWKFTTDGAKTLYVRIRDASGNVTSGYVTLPADDLTGATSLTSANCGTLSGGVWNATTSKCDWTPVNGATISGNYSNVGVFTVTSGYTVNLTAGTPLKVHGVTANIAGNLNGDYAGYTGGAGGLKTNWPTGATGGYGGINGGGIGGTANSSPNSSGGGGGGGGYGTAAGSGGSGDAAGGAAGGAGGPILASSTLNGIDINMGAGAGGGGGGGGGDTLLGINGYQGNSGGGAVYLYASTTATVSGTISMNGGAGGAGGAGGGSTDGCYSNRAGNGGGGGGGGAGGGILINGNAVTVSGTLRTNGGAGGAGGAGGDVGCSTGGAGGNLGGSGRIKVFGGSYTITNATFSATGYNTTYNCTSTNSICNSGTIYTQNLPVLASITLDSTAPAGGSITYADGKTSSTSTTITLVDGTDALSGISSKILQRASATYTNDSVGVYSSFSMLATNPVSPYTDSTITAGNAYKYQYVVTDAAGNSAVYASASVVKVFGAINNYLVSATTPQAGGIGWSETVTAKDISGNIVTTAANTATMSSSSANVKFYTNNTYTTQTTTYTLSSGAVTIYVQDTPAVPETITLTATDAALKTGTSGNITVNYPSPAPVAPPAGYTTKYAQPMFVWNAPSGYTVQQYALSIDGGADITGITNTYYRYTGVNLSNAAHTWQVKAQIGGLWTSYCATVNFTVNTASTANDITVSTAVTWDGTKIYDDVTITGTGSITHSANTATKTNWLNLISMGSVMINSGGFIDVSGKGYSGGNGPGPGVTWLGYPTGGGAHGGNGGASASAGGVAYDNVLIPADMGSSGGSDNISNSNGPAGGGFIKLNVSGTLTNNGSIIANGNNGVIQTSVYGTGAGAGGGMYLLTGTLAGSGAFAANGGNGYVGTGYVGGGGGGGRIAAYYTTYSYTGSATATGGTGANAGGTGTIYGLIDHYVFTVTSPQSAGTGFTATVTAKDVNNTTIPSGANITLTTTGSAKFYTDNTYITEKIPATYTLVSGVSPTIYIKDNVVQNIILTATGNGISTASSAITVNPGNLDHFTITSYPTSTTAGDNFGANNVVVTAYDAVNNVKTNYTGSVYFTSTDAQAVLPYTSASKYTFIGGDNGTHTFAGTGFTLKTTPSETITVTDGTISQVSSAITVNPAATLGSFTIAGFPATTTAGVPFASPANDVVVTAKDTYNNVKTNYTGSVYFTSTDAQAVLPYTSASKYTFIGGDNGTHTFAGTGFTLKTTPSETITVTDGTISQVSSAITVNPAAIASYVISATSPQTAGVGWSGSVTAKDAFGNTVTTDPGTVVTLSSASSAKFYASLTNANSDTGGSATLSYTLSSGVIPIYVRDNKVEAIALTATDALTKTGTSSAISINVAPANKIVFTSAAQTLVAGTVSTAYTVQVQDQYGNLRTSDALALTLGSNSTTGAFDTSAAGAFNGTVTSITTVNGIGTFYYKDTVTGSPAITVAYTGLTSGTQTQTITAGAITPTITSASYKAGATPNTTVAFTAANPIPIGGKIKVTFDQDYDLSGVLGVVSGNTGATVTVSDQTLIINVGTAISAGSPVSIVVSGIKNPLILGITGTYAVKTYTVADVLIDQGTAAVNTIVAPIITLLTPSAAGITLGDTQSYPITWSYDGAISNNLSLYYANEGGLVYPATPNIASAVTNSGTYTWVVPDDPRLATKVKIEDIFYQIMKDTTDTQFNAGTQSNTVVSGTGNAAGVVLLPGSAPYSSSGIYTSRSLDTGTGGAQSFGKLEWTANVPAQCGANAVKFQVAANNDNATWNFVGPDGTAATYFTVSGTSISSTLNGLRYIKYKAYLATADINYTPTLQEVKVGFASPTSANRVISSESANTFVMAGRTSVYYLSAPADIVAGTTAQYTLTRKDSNGTLVTVGNEAATLASTSTGANKQFRATAGGAALSPSQITIPDGSSAVTFYYYDEKMGTYSITASRTGVTSATDSINVLHAAADHLRFQSNITTPQKAGASFMLPLLEAVDQYGNILTGDYGATAYAGTKTISYSLSGLANAPNGTPNDSWTTSVPFTNGTSNVATNLITTLYRAQTTSIIPNDPLLPALTANVASNAIVVNPELAVTLKFTQQPSATSLINVALAVQPKVNIQDTYGNQTHDTTAVTLYDSTLNTSYLDGTGTISAVANPVSAVDGLVSFSGVKYSGFPTSASSTIYLYAQAAGLAPAYSTAITFNVASTSTVSAVTVPVANFNLIPTNDTQAKKFAVLKFRVNDTGDDGIPTLIDGIKVDIGGTGLNASTDIAWAELYDDTAAASVSSVTGAAITNTQILFGAAANNDSLAGLTSIASGTSRNYTVYIYMKPSKLTAVEGNTYTFNINETGVYADLGYSSKMAGNSAAVTPVIGTIQVDTSHIEVVSDTGASSLSLTAGVGANIILRATDANKNIDSNYTGNHTFVFSGLNPVTTYNPMVDATNFGVNKTIGFTNGVSTTALLKAYKKETGTVSVTESGQSYLCHTLSANVAAASVSKISIASGNSQTTAINTALLQPYVAFISDLYGNPVSAVSATFGIASVPSGATGQLLSVVPASSDVNGQISTILTTGNLAGTYVVSATSVGLTGSPLSFTSNVLAPTAMSKISGDNPLGKKVTEILAPFVIQVVDATSTPIPNVTVNFAITSTPSGATGALSAAQAVTDNNGQASTILTLGNKTGTYTVTASYLSYTQTFTVTANPQPPYKVVLSGPSSVNAGDASTVFTLNIQDQYSNASPVSANTVFNLTNSPSTTGGFYSDSGATISLGTQITVAGAASSNTFYYKDTVTGAPVITAARFSGDTLTTVSASVPLSVVPAGLSYFKVSAADTSVMTTGGSRAITVTAYDLQNNIKTDVSTVNVVFSGANSSPSASAPTCTNNLAADTAFGTSTALNFVNGVATTTFKAYKAEVTHIKATAGAATTSDINALNITVKHGAANHLKFSAAFTEPQGGFQAGVGFTLSVLNGVDLYDNICDGANGATAYSGTKAITYALSGTANAPDGSAQDTYTNSVVFNAGLSTSTLNTTLYRAQTTSITASDALLTGINAASGSIMVNPKPVSKLFFTQQPSTASLTNVALTQQPIVSVADMYGNAVTSAVDQVTLKASTTTGIYTAATNGTLSGTALSVNLVNGKAVFSGIKYSYPETIYLKASAANAAVVDIYSFGIAFGTATDGTLTAGPLVEPAEISSTVDSDGARVNIFDFKVSDAGTDGYGIPIKQIRINRNTLADTTGGWSTYIAGAKISDGTTTLLGTITDNVLTFGAGTSTIYTVADAGNKTFTLSIYLKQSLPVGADGKFLGFSINPNTDITVDAVGSQFTTATALTSSTKVQVTITKFMVSASASSMLAGNGIAINIKGTDINGNIDTDYIGDKEIIFSGASVASTGTNPTCTNYSAVGINFGGITLVSFAAGQSSSTITMKLYKAETAVIKATTSDSLFTTSAADALNITVTGGVASKLSWNTQPVATVAANAPWSAFKVSVVDAYGNTASSAINVTVAPTGGTLSAAATAQVAAVSGIATFDNFAVYCAAYPGTVTLNATAAGVTASGASNNVTVGEKYAITMKAFDSVNGSPLTEVTLKIIDSNTGLLVSGLTNPIIGNSPFSFNLPYGKYSFNFNKTAYVESTVNKTADVPADAVDGAYDNNISWTVFLMSTAESLADYRVLSNFVYDETNDRITGLVRLEKRGKQITSDAINTLRTSALNIFDSSDAVNPKYTASLATSDANGNYYFNIDNAVAAKGFVKGRDYFAKMTILYGGVDLSTNVTYSAANDFTISVMSTLNTLANQIVASVASEGALTRSQLTSTIESTAAATQAQVAQVSTQAAQILTATGTTIPAQITTAQTAVTDTIATKVEPHVESGILTRQNTVKQGGTATIRYRAAGSGLAPVLNVYNPKDVLLLANKPMKEIGATGVYEYDLTFPISWGTGDFSVICSESTKGTADALVMTVTQYDIETVSNNVAAVLGNTGGLTNLKDVTATLSSQFDSMDKILAQISKDVAGKLGEAKGAVNDLAVAFKQLEDMSKQIKNIGGTKGINLEKLYEVSKDKKADLEYLKNKSEELKATMELNQKMLENAGKKPVVQTWFEFK